MNAATCAAAVLDGGAPFATDFYNLVRETGAFFRNPLKVHGALPAASGWWSPRTRTLLALLSLRATMQQGLAPLHLAVVGALRNELPTIALEEAAHRPAGAAQASSRTGSGWGSRRHRLADRARRAA